MQAILNKNEESLKGHTIQFIRDHEKGYAMFGISAMKTSGA
jgi:hypothetical protein